MNRSIDPKPRILVVDDERDILNIFRLVLSSALGDQEESYELTLLTQGPPAVEVIRQSLVEGRPFAVSFIDLRLPPGRSGGWSAEQIRLLDPDVQIVLFTAYPEIDPEEISRRVRPPDKILYLQKPISHQEIKHLASALTAKWRAELNLKKAAKDLEIKVAERTIELARINQELENDIAARRRVEEELRQSEERNRLLIEESFEAILIHDCRKILFANPKAHEVFGFPPGELVGQDPFQAVRFEPLDIIKPRAEARFGDEDVPSQYEMRLQRADGTSIEIEVNARLVTLRGQKAIQVWIRDITEQKRIQNDLLQAKLEWERTFDAVPDLVAIIDLDHRITRVNHSLAERLGISPSKLVGRHCHKVIHEQDVPIDGCPHLKAIETGQTCKGEFFLSTFGGSFEVTVSPISDRDGRFIGSVHVAHDISERKKAEQKVVSALSLLTATLESTVDGLLAVDRQGFIVGYNQKFIEMWKIPSSTLIGTDALELLKTLLDQLIDPDTYMAEVKTMSSLVETESSGNIAFKDGRVFDHFSLPQRIAGQTVGRVWSFRDITERKLAEEAVKKSEKRYRDLFDNISDFIYTHDLKGRFLTVNRAMAETLGYTQEKMANRPIPDFMPTHHYEGFQEEYLSNIVQDGHVDGVTTFLAHDGTKHYIEFRNSLVRSADQPAYVRGSGRDITDRIIAEREMRNLEAQLLQSQKMEAIGTLAGGIAHDFNNILTGILGNLDLALSKLSRDHEVSRYLITSAAAVERARDLTRHLLTFSRKTEPRKKIISLAHPIQETIRLLRQTIDRRIQIEVDLASDLALVEADESQMNQVLMNLCVNAHDAIEKKLQNLDTDSPDRSRDMTITITARNLHVSPPEPDSPTPSASKPFVMVSIIDRGCGMDETTQARIFEPFFTTKPVDKGTGLGLSICYGIIKQHQGWIEVETKMGLGSTIKIFLPAAQQVTATNNDEDEPSPVPVGNETILLVDDEPIIREFVLEFLEALGYRVFTAEDGEEAWNIFADQPGRFDLVILDMVMPRLSGLEVYQRIVNLAPGAKVIISTGHSPSMSSGEPITPPPAAFVLKPYRIRELATTIREVLDQS